MARASTSWKPGQSGNPNGYTVPQETFKALFEKELRRAYRDPKDVPLNDGAPARLTNKQAMVRTTVRQAVQGNLNALVEIMNRLEGKVPDKVDANINLATTVIPWVPWDDPGAAKELGYVYVEGNDPDNHRLPPPPDSTPVGEWEQPEAQEDFDGTQGSPTEVSPVPEAAAGDAPPGS